MSDSRSSKKTLKENLEQDAYDADSEQEDEVSAILASPFKSLGISDKKEDKAAEKKALSKSKKSRTRLMLGEGNFSHSRAYLKKKTDKYPMFCSSSNVIVTEYDSEKNLSTTYSQAEDKHNFRNFKKNIAALRDMGAEIDFNIDARNIHNIFKGRYFERIHFNFPYWHEEGLHPSKNKAKTRKLVGDFFASASKIQKPGNRIHMALATGHVEDLVWYEDATYGVAEFCEKYGYVCVNKIDFIDPEKGKRLPGYFHVKTGSISRVETAETGREYVFEKRIPGKIYESSSEFRKTRFERNKLVLKHMETDSESSSGVEDSDSEKIPSSGSSSPRMSSLSILQALPKPSTKSVSTVTTSPSPKKEKETFESNTSSKSMSSSLSFLASIGTSINNDALILSPSSSQTTITTSSKRIVRKQ